MGERDYSEEDNLLIQKAYKSTLNQLEESKEMNLEDSDDDFSDKDSNAGRQSTKQD